MRSPSSACQVLSYDLERDTRETDLRGSSSHFYKAVTPPICLGCILVRVCPIILTSFQGLRDRGVLQVLATSYRDCVCRCERLELGERRPSEVRPPLSAAHICVPVSPWSVPVVRGTETAPPNGYPGQIPGYWSLRVAVYTAQTTPLPFIFLCFCFSFFLRRLTPPCVCTYVTVPKRATAQNRKTKTQKRREAVYGTRSHFRYL